MKRVTMAMRVSGQNNSPVKLIGIAQVLVFCLCGGGHFLGQEAGQGMGDGGVHRASIVSSAVNDRKNSLPLPQLIDITASAGIDFEHTTSVDQRYLVESMSGGVAIIDYDRDGWPDLYFTNAQTVESALAGKVSRSALYHNNRDGTFTDVTDKAGVGYPCWAMGAVVGDYNNDGWPDLLVTCFGGVVLYRNNGDGTFTDVTQSVGLGGDKMWATGAAFGDYDNDGWPDLFISHYVDFNLHDLPVFGSAKSCKYHGVDVQCGPRGLKGSPDSLYHNNQDGTFTDVSKQAGVDNPQHYFGLTALWSDFDNDGRLDLFVANDGGPNNLFRNLGNGSFSDVALLAGVAFSEDGAEQSNMGIASGDYRHTGRTSLLISHFNEQYASLYQNDGAMSFTDLSDISGIAHATTPYVGWGDGFFDFDNDGWPDLFIANGHVYPQVDGADLGVKYREPKLLLLNNGDGTFSNVGKQAGTALQIPQCSRGVAMGDLFNDGTIDIVVENLQGKPMILRPRGVTGHWIEFELKGVQSNRLALNARVRVYSGTMVQSDEVHSGGSYLSQNDLRLHFGLGTSDRIDKVEILWPSGKVDTLGSLAADRLYGVEEGKGIIPVARLKPSAATQR
ncbi:MAG: CRTAC1 family protein [Terracidiphilus sp.]